MREGPGEGEIGGLYEIELKGSDCVRSAPYTIAMISVHSSPLGKLGTQDTGGMSVYIRDLSRQLGLRGHAVDIYTRAGEDHEPGKALRISENVRLIPLEMGPAAGAPKTALYPHLLDFFHEADRFRLQEGIAYDLIHSHYWLSGQVGRWARQAWEAPHITTFHTLGAVKNLVCGPGSEPELRIGAERGLAAACDQVLVTSHREGANLVRFYDAETARIAVVPCGVNLDLFRPLDRNTARRRIGAGPDEKLVLFVGRFAPEKGLDRLLQAVARLKHIHKLRLIVVGGDGERDAAYRRMLELSRACGIADRVAFTGRIDQADLPPYYSAADLLALPSSYESFGMVALEAMACGTPVIASRVGGLQYTVEDGRTGFLIPEGDWRLLADRICEVVETPPLRERLVAAAKKKVRQFSWPAITKKILSLYDSL